MSHPAAAADAAPPGVPITAAQAKVQDVPEIMRGLGTVQALNVVQIKAQVTGVLTDIPVKEGQKVKKGDIVALIDPRPFQAALDQALAQLAGDQAQLKSAKLNLNRFSDLAKRQFAPVQQVDDQQATVDKLVASVEADNANIETARINLSYCTIRSPIDGRVGLYQTDAGNLIQAGSQTSGIISVTQDQPINVVFTLPEADLPRIQDEMAKGTLTVFAFTNDDHTMLATGSLTTPNNSIDTTTGTIQLKAVYANENDRLWPGEFVAAHLQITVLHNAVTVPLTAVQHGPDGTFVYIVKPDNTAAVQSITVGYQNNDVAVASKGLQGNETIVLTGQSRLDSGTRVSVKPANNDNGQQANNTSTPAN